MLGFSWNDTLGIVLVYAYILFVFLIVEKAWKGDRAVGRKILHVSMDNLAIPVAAVLLFLAMGA